jgi:hypothetical protein
MTQELDSTIIDKTNGVIRILEDEAYPFSVELHVVTGRKMYGHTSIYTTPLTDLLMTV